MVMSSLHKKPRRIMILGHELTVSFKKKMPKDLYGYFQSDPMRIVIKSDLDNWKSVLTHEVIHAILFISGHSQNMEEKEEEALVMALENGLGSILIL